MEAYSRINELDGWFDTNIIVPPVDQICYVSKPCLVLVRNTQMDDSIFIPYAARYCAKKDEWSTLPSNNILHSVEYWKFSPKLTI